MNINKWDYTVKDVAEYPMGIKDPSESVLANSVNAANYDLLGMIQKNERVLEIGCGVLSWLKCNLNESVVWDGIDVYEKDSRGRECIATRMGSVDNIPFETNIFDWVLSNQSMEHWFEYQVSIERGLAEIGRVLKVGGQAHLNFPFFLHGHPFFVQGDIDAIINLVDKKIWKIVDLIAYIDSNEDNYMGWRRCGFPDAYVYSKGRVATSFVVNLVLKKISSIQDLYPEKPEARPLVLSPKISPIRMACSHGLYVLLWKLFYKLTRGRTGG